MLDMENFGRRLAYLRHRSRLTQRKIAEACCVTVQAVSKWEQGRSCPDILILDDLAKSLGVSISDLFEQENHIA